VLLVDTNLVLDLVESVGQLIDLGQQAPLVATQEGEPLLFVAGSAFGDNQPSLS
jgi:hypothetical protein